VPRRQQTSKHDEHPSEETSSDTSIDVGDEMRRAPGRPRKILTGKPGRPAKQYNLRPVTREPDELTTARDSGEEEHEYMDAEFAMSAYEVPLQRAISGPNKR